MSVTNAYLLILAVLFLPQFLFYIIMFSRGAPPGAFAVFVALEATVIAAYFALRLFYPFETILKSAKSDGELHTVINIGTVLAACFAFKAHSIDVRTVGRRTRRNSPEQELYNNQEPIQPLIERIRNDR